MAINFQTSFYLEPKESSLDKGLADFVFITD